jgi:polysaccharide biosynthesis transport protein
MEYNAPQSQSINILDVLYGIGRRKIMIMTIFGLSLLLGSLLIMTLKPVYTTEAQILVENLSSPFEKSSSEPDQRPEPVDDRVVLSQMSVIKSQDLVGRVITALKLTERGEFNPVLTGMGTVKSISLMLGFGEDPRLMTPEQRAQKRISDQITVYQVPESNVIAIKYTSADGATAAEVANTLAEFYVMSTREAQSTPTDRARDWLGTQIEDLRKKVALSDAAVEQFRNEAGLLQGTSVTLGTEELSELSKQITLAEASRTEAEAKLNEINDLLKNKGSVDTSAEVLNSPIVQRLREQQTASVRRLSELSATYLNNHPRMIAAQNDVTNIDRQIRREALKVVDGLQGQAKIAAAREKSLRNSLEQMKGRESTANIDEVKLRSLERNATADRALLESMLNRYSDASTRQGEASQPGMARIIQLAGAPSTPSFPKTGPMTLLISAAGLTLALGLAFLMEVMAAANRLQETAQNAIARHPARAASEQRIEIPQIIIPSNYNLAPAVAAAPSIQMPVIATSPSFSTTLMALDAAQNLDETDRFGLGQAAVRISSPIIELKKSQGIQHVAVISVGGNAADCALTTLALARVLSEQKLRTIVVDVDATGQSFEMLFGIPIGAGLSDLVSGAADFTKIIARDPLSSAHIVRFGVNKTPATVALLKQRIDAVLTTFAGIYDVVLVHAGEANGSTQGMIGRCKSVVLLAPKARERDAASAAQTLQKAGVTSSFYVSLVNRDSGADQLAVAS